MQHTTNPHQKSLANFLWGPQAKLIWLIFATLVILFLMLCAKELWTHEWRWANIVHNMLRSQDFFHPELMGQPYYDKPLLSYWFMTGISLLIGKLNLIALRLPSAIAGLMTVYCTYHLGARLINKQAGLIASWLLISTFYFVFWSRVASADMLNVSGIMMALVWYFERRDKPNLFSYTIFFFILAIAALLKGLIAIAITLIVLIPELLHDNQWKKHFNCSFLIGLLLGFILYFTPFCLSAHFNTAPDATTGLLEVFRENILRYIKPFDHQGPIYTYFIFFPLYTFPWILFFIPAVLSLRHRWHTMDFYSRFFAWATLLIFIFLTLSGSRRSYYILPILPFALLFTADWIRTGAQKHLKRYTIASWTTVIFYSIILLIYSVAFPLIYSKDGIKNFATQVRQAAIKIQPWKNWQITLLNTKPKTAFYLQSPQKVQFKKTTYSITSLQALQQALPDLANPKSNQIFILPKNYLPNLQSVLPQYHVIISKPNWGDQLLQKEDETDPVALLRIETQLKVSP